MKRSGHGWIGAASAVIRATYRAVGAELEGKAFSILTRFKRTDGH